MKMINECLDRLFNDKKPLKIKWQAFIENDKLYFYHYQHNLLIYDLKQSKSEFVFYETRTDLRGLNAALQYLKSKNFN